ncbi:hypothetical protein CKO51_25780 [Rhodopirellula sp. SM50]|nr:hypothetical protein CKO51_25780 [Rhodopirellula sp. SM50]
MSHAGGNWDLGAEGNVVVDELSVAFQPKSQGQVDSLSLDLLDCDRSVVSTRSIQLLQASSGGQNWDSRVHVDRSGNVPLSFRGYHVEADGQSFDGLRAVPVLNANFGDKSLSIGCRYFWQNFPSSMFADSEGLRLGLFPRRPTGGEELQGGEQKTFEFAVAYGSETAQSKLRKFVESDAADAASCASTDSVSWPYLTPRSDASDKRYEALVNQAIEGDDSFFTKREKVDEYGWRNFGDVWGDHEAVFHKGDSPLISHYNNQYDCTLGFGIQYLRTGDKRWLELMIPMADHAWDIDTYHTDQDKLVYNGGLFWHTYHYADAHTSTHRSYPKNLRISEGMQGGTDLSELGQTGDTLAKVYQIGGGPAAAHNYNTGWMVAYWLTGKERYKNAAINGADYVMRIDDGGKTPFRWLSRADTGYSTYSSEDYYGPGRAAANSTHALLTGHEITGDRKYLDRASLLMRRTVHPKQDLPRLDLLNAELRWFYTMYLQALGRYVDYKLNLDELDSDFRYGVACLRHYARWMTENERPTLSEPDKLQYPTETWSAQDMRKWHVLEHAARYECDEVIRARMCAKADFFFNYVVDYLTQSPTKSLCRPVILMLNFGWQREWLVEHRDAPAFTEEIEDDFGEPRTFVPQRAIAIKRFKMLVVAGGVVGIGSMAAIFAWLLFG